MQVPPPERRAPAAPDADARPGYRRLLVVEPSDASVVAMLEDDMHRMAVVLHHADGLVVAIEPVMDRAPWDTCPGARARLIETFNGTALAEVTARREKKQNCTHLHDLAVLAAAHAHDDGKSSWDIRVSDPENGERILTIRRNGILQHRWQERDGMLVAPAAVAGKHLMALRDWIGSLSGAEQESARLLQWGGLVAHGRTIPLDQQSQASALPANCYTLQPERAIHARRVGQSLDFSDGSRKPLAGMDESVRSNR